MNTREFLEKYDADEIQQMMDNGLLNEQIEEMRAMGRTDAQIGEQLAKRWSDEKLDKVAPVDQPLWRPLHLGTVGG